MSLPPGFLDELRTRTSLSQVVGRKVMWDQRKSNQGKGDMWAPCPFHHEKSASFHVDDRKGYYYCFGCHAKGDAISFIKDTENVGFMEAVEILAGEAGLPMPARDPRAQEKADRRTLLAEAREILLKHRPADTPVMLASSLGRPEEHVRYRRLEDLEVDEVDMLTVVLIGSSNSRLAMLGEGPRMFTPRDYARKIDGDLAQLKKGA